MKVQSKIFLGLLLLSATPALAEDAAMMPSAIQAPAAKTEAAPAQQQQAQTPPAASAETQTASAPKEEPPPQQYYEYANNDSEYSVTLPEAPKTETIWGDATDTKVPYLENPPTDGALGEVATYRTVDMETEDFFDVHITFLKADPDFLSGLTEEKMKKALENDFKDLRLENKAANFSENAKHTLKWATLGGFSTDKESGRPVYNSAHYLTGQKSILVVRVQYNVQNKNFEEYYKKLVDNISYHAL